MVAERSCPNRIIPKMSASLPTISMSDEEDAQIHKHKAALEKVKHMKEE